MGLYDILDPKEEGKEVGHVMFKELPPISAGQKETIVNEIQHIPI